MYRITTGLFTVALLILGGVVAAAAQGSDRGQERRGFDTPPGLQGKPVAVPDTGSTLTLLSIALGSGLFVRSWASRRHQRGS